MWVASIALVICLAVFSSLLGLPRVGGRDLSGPTRAGRAVAAVERARAGVRAEPALRLDEFVGLGPELRRLNPEMAALLKPARVPLLADDPQDAAGGREQLAALSPERGGDGAR